MEKTRLEEASDTSISAVPFNTAPARQDAECRAVLRLQRLLGLSIARCDDRHRSSSRDVGVAPYRTHGSPIGKEWRVAGMPVRLTGVRGRRLILSLRAFPRPACQSARWQHKLLTGQRLPSPPERNANQLQNVLLLHELELTPNDRRRVTSITSFGANTGSWASSLDCRRTVRHESGICASTRFEHRRNGMFRLKAIYLDCRREFNSPTLAGRKAERARGQGVDRGKTLLQQNLR